MAPMKRKSVEEEDGEAKPATAATVTRRSTRLANSNSRAVVPPTELPPKKKGKANVKKEKAVEPEKEAEAEETSKAEEAKEEAAEDGGTTKTIVVEHCKQCNSFKTRAVKVKDGLETAVPGVTVVLNPEKPRRGCFEIREEDGETFISLLDLKRPFKAMKDLDMDKVISNIIDKIKS